MKLGQTFGNIASKACTVATAAVVGLGGGNDAAAQALDVAVKHQAYKVKNKLTHTAN